MNTGKPGTIANELGDIWVYCSESPEVSTRIVTTGTVALNAEQAAEATKYGWKLDSIDEKSGLYWMKR